MIQGTASGVGKSVLVAGLCRLLARNGISVAPFKPQNMSNNAAVTVDGGEIGRAQALQAFACGIEPSVHMNPVLIKPESDQKAQLIVQGKAVGHLHAKKFREDRTPLLDTVLESFRLLQQQYDFIVIEGAGCPAEPNLMQGDIANMGFAEAANVPVWLAGDIDKGGVFASLKGCIDILNPSEQNRITATLINRFRGNIELLKDAITWLEQQTHKPVAGVIPMLRLNLPEEDAPFKHQEQSTQNNTKPIRIHVISYPYMSNHDDIDPLASDSEVQLTFIRNQHEYTPCDLLILPGSKHVTKDLQWLRSQGFEQLIKQHLRYGGKILGICGGLQMLGQFILGNETSPEETGRCEGLGLLPFSTQMMDEKVLRRISENAIYPKETHVTGYEIHHGLTETNPNLFPFAAHSEDKQIWATYVHGLFEQGEFRKAWLESLGFKTQNSDNQNDITMRSLDELADQLEKQLKPELLSGLLQR